MLRDVERRLLPYALATLLAALTLLLGVAGTSGTTLGRASGSSAHTEAGGVAPGAATSTNGGRLAVRERLAAAASRIQRGHSSPMSAFASPRAGSVTGVGGAKTGEVATSTDGAPSLVVALLNVAVATPAAAPIIDREGVPSGRGPPPASGV